MRLVEIANILTIFYRKGEPQNNMQYIYQILSHLHEFIKHVDFIIATLHSYQQTHMRIVVLTTAPNLLHTFQQVPNQTSVSQYSLLLNEVYLLFLGSVGCTTQLFPTCHWHCHRCRHWDPWPQQQQLESIFLIINPVNFFIN